MRHKAILSLVISLLIGFALFIGSGFGAEKQGNAQAQTSKKGLSENDRLIDVHARRMIDDGRRIFRFDTFGSEAFWGDALQLHKAIAGEKNGGVGGGVSPKTALSVGLKVDADALPDKLIKQIKAGNKRRDRVRLE